MKGVIVGAAGLAVAGENITQKMRRITISLCNISLDLLKQVYTKFMAIFGDGGVCCEGRLVKPFAEQI